MKKNIFILVFLLLAGLLFQQCTTSGSDVLTYKRQPNGGYFFVSSGERLWVNKSFREGSLSGKFRGGGPHAGK